jgi:hypothetical protein
MPTQIFLCRQGGVHSAGTDVTFGALQREQFAHLEAMPGGSLRQLYWS